MANNIKGITIEIGGDTTGLDKALSGTNKNISTTQSELKQVERLLKLDPTNTELLKQKQELLGKAVGETSDKLNVLKTAESQAQKQFKEGKISEEQYRALQREIVSTENSLKDLKTSAAESNAMISKISQTAQNVADKTKALSTAASGLLVGIGAAAVSAGAKADDLNTLAKQTGFTVEELQKMQYASDIVDVAVDDMTKAAAKLTKNMISTSSEVQGAWETLGVSVTDTQGQMRPVTDVFYDTLSALSKVGNETERDQLAMLLFGKSANELAGIVDDGGAALKALGQEAENAGLIMSQDAVDGANEFNDAIDRMKATVGARLGEIGTQIATLLLPYLERLVEIVCSVIGWFANMDPVLQGVIIGIIALVAAISPIAGIIASINAVMSVSPVTWIILAIVAAVAALIAIIVLCVKHFDKIKAVALDVWEKIRYGAEVAWWGIQVAAITVINLIIKYINLMIKNALTPINLLIKGLNLIPGVSIKELKFKIQELDIPEMPKLALGGSVMVGEAGPEVLTHYGNRVQVTPLTGSGASHALGGTLGDVVSAITKLGRILLAGNAQDVYLGEKKVGAVMQPTISSGLSSSTISRKRATGNA